MKSDTQFMQLRKKREKNSGLLELCRALRNNHDLPSLHLKEGGYFLIIFFGFAKVISGFQSLFLPLFPKKGTAQTSK